MVGTEVNITVDFPDQNKLLGFANFVFNTVGAANHSDFSAVLIEAHRAGRNLAAEIQDTIMSSAVFDDFANDSIWNGMAAKVLDAPESEILIVFPHLRIDLPSHFSDDEARMSLPWHQEAGYYLEKGSCSPKSIVISTYLHDCDRRCGAVEIGCDTFDGLEFHADFYRDEEHKRFKRVECRAPEGSQFSETKFGESVIFDFLVPHRSGRNETTDLVRTTMLVRASWARDVDEWKARELVR